MSTPEPLPLTATPASVPFPPDRQLLSRLRESAHRAEADPRPSLSSKQDATRTRRAHEAHRAAMERELGRFDA